MTITINSLSSKKLNINQMTRLTLQSNALSVSWEIIKYPSTINSDVSPIMFENTSTLSSSASIAYMTCFLSGTYVIKATELNQAPVYYYVEAVSLSNEQVLPYVGERNEIDNVNGWGGKNNKVMSYFEMIAGSATVSKAVLALDAFSIGDVVGVNGVYQASSNNMIYLAGAILTSGTFGLIVEKFTVTNENLFGAGEAYENYAFFRVLTLGSMVVANNGFSLSVDGNNKFYYNSASGLLTTSSSDVYVGTWDSTTRVLTIENIDVVSNYISGGGGEPTVGVRTVIVDSALTAEAGKVYNTLADADAYVATQSPSASTPWAIIVYGTNAENFSTRDYVFIKGIRESTILSGTITPNSFTTNISNCTITGTLDIVSGETFKVMVIEDSIFNGTITMDSSGGGQSILYFNRNCYIEPASVTSVGGATGIKFIYVNDSIIYDGVWGGGLYDALRLSGSEIIGGEFYNVDAKNSVISNCTFNAGTYSFENCSLASSITLPDDDYGLLFAKNTYIDDFTVILGASSAYKLTNCGFGSANVSIPVVPDQFITEGCVGNLNVSGTQANAWQNEGDAYDNSGSMIVADEMQGVVDEIGFRLKYYSANISDPPTAAQINGVTGLLPGTVPRGFTFIIDNNSDANNYLVCSNGTSWWILTQTKAV